jgi:hypothetical protein
MALSQESGWLPVGMLDFHHRLPEGIDNKNEL